MMKKYIAMVLLNAVVPTLQAVDMGAYPYANEPIVRLEADGRQHNLSVYAGQTFNLALSIDAGTRENQAAEWWLVAQIGDQFFSYQSATGNWQDGSWHAGIHVAFQKPVQSFEQQALFGVALPAGALYLYAGVDTLVDGQLSPTLRYDVLHLNVADSGRRIFYVSPQGDDSHVGSLDQPWRTANKAGSSANAGDLVLFRAGIYAEQFDIIQSGTAAQPLVFAAAAGEKVIFDGSNLRLNKPAGAPFAALINAQGVQHVWIMGFEVMNSAQAGIAANQSSGLLIQNNRTYNTKEAGIAVWESDDFIVDGNDITLANNGSGTQQENLSIASGSANFAVRYNYVHDSGSIRGHDGISIKDGAHDGAVHHNLVQDINNNSCMYIDGWDSSVHNIQVYNNRFSHCPYHGLSLAAERGGTVSGIQIYNNVFSNNGYIESMDVIGMGLHLGSGYTFLMQDIDIYNNTFYNNGPGDAYSGSLVLRNRQGDGIRVHHNIFASDDFQIQILPGHVPSNVVIENNLFSHADKTSSNGETQGDNPIIADPLFVNATANDFRLQAGSAAIKKGE